MKTLLTIVLFFQAIYSNNPHQRNDVIINAIPQKELMANSEKEIEDLLSKYQTSLNNSDAKMAQNLYSNNGTFMPAGAPSAKGKQNILEAYENIFSQIELNITFNIEQIIIEGNIAYAHSTSKGSVLIKATGQNLSEENRELFLFKKVSGEWKIESYMFNKTKQ